jgi:hypothetical protein
VYGVTALVFGATYALLGLEGDVPALTRATFAWFAAAMVLSCLAAVVGRSMTRRHGLVGTFRPSSRTERPASEPALSIWRWSRVCRYAWMAAMMAVVFVILAGRAGWLN